LLAGQKPLNEDGANVDAVNEVSEVLPPEWRSSYVFLTCTDAVHQGVI
jgi:hypothetical protein